MPGSHQSCGRPFSSNTPPIAFQVINADDRSVANLHRTASTILEPQIGATRNTIQIVTSKTDHESLRKAAELMVDAYWLASPVSLIAKENDCGDGPSSPTSSFEEGRNNLINVQLQDFVERYDASRGDRLLHSRLLTAVGHPTDPVDGGSITPQKPEILGIVGMEVRLCDEISRTIHSTQESERIILDAVIGDKSMVRQATSMPACIPRLVENLLPSELSAVCVLSNLAVSPKARRQGLATRLCKEVERLARTYCGCTRVYLEVETINNGARKLYEGTLGYEQLCEADAPAKRVDLRSGEFIEIAAPTLVLSKDVTNDTYVRS